MTATEIIEAYESYDCDSLCEEANLLSDVIYGYLKRNFPIKDALIYMVDCGFYFVDIDREFDGAESDVFRAVYGDNQIYYQSIASYRRYSREYAITRVMVNAPASVREAFFRFGCCLLASKGYISQQERSVLLKWC